MRCPEVTHKFSCTIQLVVKVTGLIYWSLLYCCGNGNLMISGAQWCGNMTLKRISPSPNVLYSPVTSHVDPFTYRAVAESLSTVVTSSLQSNEILI